MPKSLAEILGSIQDPEAKSVLESQIADFNAKATRLNALDSQLVNSELVDRTVASGWREFSKTKQPVIEKELTDLRAEVARLRPEAERATALAKQIEGGSAADPNDFMKVAEKAFEGRFLSANDRAAIIAEATKQAVEISKQATNFGSIPALAGMIEAKMNAKAQYGLDIPIETIGEAVTRYGSVEKAYEGLTASASQAKAVKDREEAEARHKADIEKAREEGRVLGLRESETRGYSPEEGASSGTIPMIPAQTGNDIVVDPTKYNPADGNLAREAAKLLAAQEAAGVYGKVM
jgi:hypothetical protein